MPAAEAVADPAGICLTVSGVPSGPQKEMAALLTAGPEASSPDPPPRCTKASAAAPRRAPSTCWCPRPRSVTAPASRGCSGPAGCPPGPRESGTVPTLNSRPHGTQGVGRIKSKHVNQHIDMHIGNFLYSQKRSYQNPAVVYRIGSAVPSQRCRVGQDVTAQIWPIAAGPARLPVP